MNKAVFLDRDGVITEDPPHYAHRIDQLKVIPKVAEAIKMLNDEGYIVVVVSNQSGIARGFYPEKDAHVFNNALAEELVKQNASIDGFYFCPHHPQAKVEEYRVNCDCRKPNTGMIENAVKDFEIDTSKSFMIGDRNCDMIAGKKAGCKTIHVLTGVGVDQTEKYDIDSDHSADNLFEAVTKFILK